MIIQGYRWLLRLYPRPFYQHFADEMQEVFAQRWHDARRNQRPVLFLLSELTDLVRNIMLERLTRQPNMPESPQRLQTARRIVQVTTALMYIAFAWFFSIAPLGGTTLSIFLLFNGLILAGFAVTLGNERVGGWLMIGAASLWYLVLTGAMLAQAIPLWGALLGGLVYTLPFMLVGWLYTRIAAHATALPD